VGHPEYAVAVCNATAGLHLAAHALGVRPGTNVIVTPLTFASSANCVRFCGGNVTFCDIDPETYLMDTVKLRQLLEASPRGTYQGIIVVDFAGYPHQMEELRHLADEYGCWIIEDACHAPGAYFVDSKGEKQYTGNSRFADAYRQLPQEFTVEDVERLMDVTNNAARAHCTRWVQAGYTKRKRQGTYQKLL
jgi:dTDP-4-amino-4,6-dideoxygalactose transaminase